jgi:serine/threonine-protein kinase
MTTPYDMKPGAVVAGRYRLERPLGQGGMGEVWAASHLITRKHVALKALKAEKAARPELVRRFFREARAATAVGHPNVVAVHDVFSFEGGPVMVMELLEGESLGEKLRRQGTLSPAELAAVLVPVVSAVGTAHARGIVHRDLKPENIFLARGEGESCTPKVLDFGIAKLAEEELSSDAADLTRTGSMVGTPFYMAPEQAAGERDFDHRCDVWALGVIGFEALVGRRPFGGDNFGQIFKRIITEEPASLRQLLPDLPRNLADLIDDMLVKERTARRDLAEVMTVLGLHTATTAPTFAAPFSEVSRLAVDSLDVDSLDDVGSATLTEATLASANEPLLGTLEATTRGHLATNESWLSPRKARLGLGGAALGLTALAAAVVWSMTRPLPMAEAPPAQLVTATRALLPLASAAPPAVSAEARAPEAQPSALPPPATTAAPRPNPPRPIPSANRPAPLAPSAQRATAAPPPPKRLPGGILDQERAPF